MESIRNEMRPELLQEVEDEPQVRTFEVMGVHLRLPAPLKLPVCFASRHSSRVERSCR